MENVEDSIQALLKSGIDYEFRTTVVPSLHSKDDLKEIARGLNGCNRYVLQKFQPERARDDSLRGDKSQSDGEMEELVKVIKRYIPNSKWRGK
jgi:pyruvate formate lyase activating enzyme